MDVTFDQYRLASMPQRAKGATSRKYQACLASILHVHSIMAVSMSPIVQATPSPTQRILEYRVFYSFH